jgi:Na+/phosphate symporter
VLQGAGGGIAATANTTSQSNAGKNIMLAGLVFQVISLTLFAIACAEFAWRVSKNPEQWNQQHINIAASKLFKAFLFGNSSRT